MFISGRSAHEWCQNQFVWLHDLPPACITTSKAERVIGASTLLQHPALRICPQRYQLTPGNQTCFLIPTTQEATASPEYSVSAVEEV